MSNTPRERLPLGEDYGDALAEGSLDIDDLCDRAAQKEDQPPLTEEELTVREDNRVVETQEF